ncbi:BirA family biotin operon repressor/biotin-[acetyl-CoA-carboxylase] ligase [Catalinimonas alkaloidigena]|uniref:biotin--[acetyl-CoA-carboxylase] ligase n=1 Tax=Catalinimonas alkaloidigena TaxID=1075417 RepID=UPI002404A455|nr:biotin--[acetyl-CoA-carboxylase] ligase [Catalinimonas alkaloidigena]MDF9795515.1 BirA family biotin operon repressor/biotin-[acetyl-CoA-carboxylase] ligase [Catalinimonas alkaloidigena]
MPINSFNTQFIGRQFLHYPVCDSTNAVVMQKLATPQSEHSLENGAIVMADFQTAGRGQRDARWTASPGLNLTFTIALLPNLPVQQQFYLNIITTLAISDSLKPQLGESLSEQPSRRLKIKWPNDLYYDDHKLCGILIQNNLKVNMIQSCAIGIGLNVNQLHFDGVQATSLKTITKSSWDRYATLKEIALHFEERYFQLKAMELTQLKKEYLAQLYWYNTFHSFQDKDGVFQGRIIDVLEGGELLVEREAIVKQYQLKEITYLY